MMPKIDFDNKNYKIEKKDKERIVSYLISLKNNFEKKHAKKSFLSSIYKIINDFEEIKKIQPNFIISQIKLVLLVLKNLPKNQYQKASEESKEYLKKIIINLEEDYYFKASRVIWIWYNSTINFQLKEKIEVDPKKIANMLKNKGRNAVKNPKQVKELYQMFTKNYHTKFNNDSENFLIPFLLKYLQQSFKEISYDGGIFFDQVSYDNFTKNFGKTCEKIGINLLNSDEKEIFLLMFNFYNYTHKLKEYLYENKIQRN